MTQGGGVGLCPGLPLLGVRVSTQGTREQAHLGAVSPVTTGRGGSPPSPEDGAAKYNSHQWYQTESVFKKHSPAA